MTRAGLCGAMLAALVAAPAPGAAQSSSEIVAEIGASAVRPPVGVDGPAGRFVVGGLRGSHRAGVAARLAASVLGGWSLDDAAGGDFLSGRIEGDAWRRMGGGWRLGFAAEATGFVVRDPFRYRAVAAEGGPELRYAGGRSALRVAGVIGVGGSRTEVTDRRGRTLVLGDDLWRQGVEADAFVSLAGGAAGVAVGAHRSAAGGYRMAGARIVFGSSGPAAELRADVWWTPDGRRAAGGVAFVVPAGPWSLRGFAGRTEPDPLTLAEPGGGSGGALVGLRVAGGDGAPPRLPPLYADLGPAEGGRRVRITLQGAGGASTVGVLGDFTLWEPVAMKRTGNGWSVDLVLQPGTYHYGFVVDDAWYLPPDAPDTVPDEFGRRSATMVIETEPGAEPFPGEESRR